MPAPATGTVVAPRRRPRRHRRRRRGPGRHRRRRRRARRQPAARRGRAGNGRAAPSVPRPAASSARPRAGRRRRGRSPRRPTRGLARRLGVDLADGRRERTRRTDHRRRRRPPPRARPAGRRPGRPPCALTHAAPASSGAPAAPAAGTRIPLRGVRKRTAETMTAAWQAVPHVDSFHEIDVTDLFAAPRAVQAGRPPSGASR